MANTSDESNRRQELFIEVAPSPARVGRQENIFRIFRLAKDAVRRWNVLPLPTISRKEMAPTEKGILGLTIVSKARMVASIFEEARFEGQRVEAGQTAALKPGSEASVDYRVIVLTQDGRLADAICTVDRLRSTAGWHDIRRTLNGTYRFWVRRNVPEEVTELETIIDSLSKAVAAATVLMPIVPKKKGK